MSKRGLNQSDLKIRNRSKVLKILRAEKNTSRKDISEQMNLTKAAITSIISELIDENYIVEIGSQETGSIGRKKIILKLNKNFKFVFGLSISESHMIILVANLLGETIDTFFYEFSQEESYDNVKISNLIIEKSLHLLWNNNIEKSSIIGFGISSVGELKIVDVNYIKEQIINKLGIEVVSDNNVKALAISQMDFGLTPLNNNFLFVKYGPGLGMAIVQNGKIISGINNKAGEIGHTIIDINADTTCRCGRKGCLESLVSERGIIKDIEKLGKEYDYLILNKSLSTIDYKSINELMEKDNKHIQAIFEKRYDYFSKALANSVILLNPEYICVYGSIFSQPHLLEIINKRVNSYLGTNTTIMLKLSDLDPNNSAIGSAALALKKFFYDIESAKTN